jgi:hypothetical protein
VKDENAKFLIAAFKIGEELEVRAYVVPAGENFVRFGGSSRGLTVTKTPSLIISDIQYCRNDVEYDIHDKKGWTRLFRLAEKAGYNGEMKT